MIHVMNCYGKNVSYWRGWFTKLLTFYTYIALTSVKSRYKRLQNYKKKFIQNSPTLLLFVIPYKILLEKCYVSNPHVSPYCNHVNIWKTVTILCWVTGIININVVVIFFNSQYNINQVTYSLAVWYLSESQETKKSTQEIQKITWLRTDLQ